MKEGNDVIDEIFARLERGEVQQRPANAGVPCKEPDAAYGEGLKNVGKKEDS